MAKKYKIWIVIIDIVPFIVFSFKIIHLLILRGTAESIYPGFLFKCSEYKVNDKKENLREYFGVKRKRLYKLFICCSDNGNPDKNLYEGYEIISMYNIEDIKNVDLKKYCNFFISEH